MIRSSSFFRRSALAFALLPFVAGIHAATAPAAPKKIRIVLVGDSTVTDQNGWGIGFKQFVNDTGAECINTSRGGRSSKSFIDEGLWKIALGLKADYYIIQFGHNDEPGKGPERETDPATTFPQHMARYIDEARAIGAKPILVTSLTRRKFEATNKHKLVPSLVPYAAAVRKLAVEKRVPLVDLHARSIGLCEQLGEEACAPISARGAGGSVDTTHLNGPGSLVFARLVVDELRKSTPELAPALRIEPNLATPAADRWSETTFISPLVPAAPAESK